MSEAYFDNSATTKIRPEALRVYCEVSERTFGNPSSLHNLGQAAEGEIEKARKIILSTIGAKDSEIVFTASGSEANNLAIIGRALAKERYRRGAKIITTMGEHSSVSEPLSMLEKEGFKVIYLPTVGGEIDIKLLERELTGDCILVSVMLVNNETGAVYDIPRVAKTVKANCPEALVHVDATQGYMKIPFTKAALGADMITISSHKIEGPKGVGALIFDKSIVKSRGLCPIIFGGGQEGGYRSGTENVPAVAAFAEAARLAKEELSESYTAMRELKEYIINEIRNRKELGEISITLPKRHAPHIINITLPGIKSETMLHYLSALGVYVSSGSACSSNSNHLSSALIGFGRTEKEADSSIRISLSHRNTKEEADMLLCALEDGIKRLCRVGE